MIDYDKIKDILSQPDKEYQQFKVEHEKRLQRLIEKENELYKEYSRLLKQLNSQTVKMKVL